jgi:hypothetical protein
MRITHYRNLNENEAYLATKKEIKEHFKDVEGMSVVFGLKRGYEIDSRCSTKLNLVEPVLISITCDREKELILSLYHILRNKLNKDMTAQFYDVVMPSIKEWINKQVNKPDTAILGVEELVYSWDGGTYSKQELKYL